MFLKEFKLYLGCDINHKVKLDLVSLFSRSMAGRKTFPNFASGTTEGRDCEREDWVSLGDISPPLLSFSYKLLREVFLYLDNIMFTLCIENVIEIKAIFRIM